MRSDNERVSIRAARVDELPARQVIGTATQIGSDARCAHGQGPITEGDAKHPPR